MTCTCKVFSTLILDSRYFYSPRGKKKKKKRENISFSRLMLRNSCLYSSLACSVYSICWIYFFFLLVLKITSRYIYSSFEHDDSHAQRSVQLRTCWFFFFFFWIHKWRWIHSEVTVCGGRIYWSKRNVLKQGCVVCGWVAIGCRSLNVTWSERWLVEVTALFRNVDVAVTSSGL